MWFGHFGWLFVKRIMAGLWLNCSLILLVCWNYSLSSGWHVIAAQGFASVLGSTYMMTSSNGNIFRVTGHLCGEFTGPGEFPTQRPVTRSFDVYFDLRPNKRLSKQSLGWWFETLSPPLWRHRNELSLLPKSGGDIGMVSVGAPVHLSIRGLRPLYWKVIPQFHFRCIHLLGESSKLIRFWATLAWFLSFSPIFEWSQILLHPEPIQWWAFLHADGAHNNKLHSHSHRWLP